MNNNINKGVQEWGIRYETHQQHLCHGHSPFLVRVRVARLNPEVGVLVVGLYVALRWSVRSHRVFPERASPPTFGSSCNHTIHQLAPTTVILTVIVGCTSSSRVQQ